MQILFNISPRISLHYKLRCSSSPILIIRIWSIVCSNDIRFMAGVYLGAFFLGGGGGEGRGGRATFIKFANVV